MMEVYTQEQKLLIKYLKTTKIPLATGLLIVMMLWEEKATEEMLRYIADTQESDPAKLYSIALEISQKYPTQMEQT